MSTAELTELKGLERILKVSIPAQDVDGQVKKKLNDYANQAEWKGFRKGKVPKNLIQSKVGQQIRANVLNDMLEPSLVKALKENDLDLAGQPSIDLLVNEQGKNLEYEAKFEVVPQFDLVDLAKCKVKNPTSELPESAVNDGVEKVKQQHMDWSSVDAEAADGLQVTIDFTGTLNGEPFPGGSAQDYSFVLGNGQMLPEFEQAILTKRAGDTIEFPLTFPKDYHQKTLAGLTVSFVVNLKGVQQGTEPKMDQAFFEKVDVAEGTEEAFLNAVREPLQNELDSQLANLRKARLYNVLMKKHKFDLPKVMVDQEQQALLQEIKQNQRLDAAPELTKELTEKARKRVLLSLVSNKLIDTLELKVDNKRLEAFIRSKAMPYIEEEKFLEWFYSDEQRVQMAARQVLEEQLVESCFAQFETEDEVIDYGKIASIIEEEWNL